ncbi:MAG: PTS sugar transporter subunit IIA [Gemmatimonadales bacterium]
MSEGGRRLVDCFAPAQIRLDLAATTKADAIAELLAAFELSPRDHSATMRAILRREAMGSTAIGRGIAVPHARTPLVSQLRVAFGRSVRGIPFGTNDDDILVHHVFLFLAPPVDVSNEYLPMLGQVARLGTESDTAERLAGVTTVAEFLAVLDEVR